MKRALLSVSDKDGIIPFAGALEALDFTIISTGGTYRTLKENGIEATEISDVTEFPEMFDGRVKTLHPKIHGGILHRRDLASHREAAQSHGIDTIDLVCVNLYPFKATIERTDDFDEIIENIDIGGPAMVRSAAKNFADVLIVTDPADYTPVLEALRGSLDDTAFRRNLMVKAFEHTAAYDSMIAGYMNRRFNDGMGQKQFIVGEKVMQTRYGENPHQRGALYAFGDHFTGYFKTLKGEASFNNLGDINGAIKIAAAFGDADAVCIVKHGNPCGFAIRAGLKDAYEEALKCDPISAFGGVVAVNGVIDAAMASTMNEIFLEVIIAGRISEEALKIFETKKRLNLFECGSDRLVVPKDAYDFKHIEGGFIYQDADRVADDEIANARCMSEKRADDASLQDAQIAWKVAALTKSNCVVYVKDAAMVAIGMGMTSRVDAAQCALKKAASVGLDVTGAALASEAFFPFRDSIDAAAAAGVTTVIEPGGSIRDDEVITAANEHGMALYFTGVRHFLH